jgi:peptide/nickel transport system substrate-binding protein
MDYESAIPRRTVLAFESIGLGAVALGLAGCTGPSVPAMKANAADLESPMLAKRVKAGTLPKLEKRLPASPMVVKPFKTTGTFGGTIRRAQTSPTDTGVMQAFAGVGLIEWTMAATKSQASLAEKFTKSDDNRVYTFTIRKGLKWSDGKPFTVDDVLFATQNWLGNKALVPVPPGWFGDVNQTLPSVEKQGSDTVVITFKKPFALFEKYMCNPAVSSQIIKPKHYLQQFHPDFTDATAVDTAAKAAGFDTWDQYFSDRDNWWTNAKRPTMGAFMVTGAASAQTGTATLERNPYFWKTDPDGRQLPYVDRLQVQVLEQSALDLRAANGDLDMQGYFLGYNSTQVYLKNAASHGYKVLRWTPTGTLLSLCPNLSHKDPVLRELFLKRDFRMALSYAIDRDEINQTLLGGLGVVEQPVSPDDSPYGIRGGGRTAIKFDRKKANALLDGLGLKLVGDTRVRADGVPIELNLTFIDDDFQIPRADAFAMVQKQWAKVGIKINLHPVDSTLYRQLGGSNALDIDGTTMIQDDWDMEPVWFVPINDGSHSAPGYGLWYSTSGKEGMAPPPEFKQLMDNWDQLRAAPSDAVRIAAGKRITEQHDKELYNIGLMRLPFQPVVVNKKLENVRDDKPQLSFYYGREGISKPEQMYYAA